MSQAEMKNEQIRFVSHEIRNHVSICDVYTEIIKKHLQKEGIENPSINNAISCIEKSLKIISTSLLDLKSINTTKIQKFDLNELMLRATEMSKVYIQDKKINIHYQCANQCILVNLDENKFLASIVNIIKNAIEAIDNKGDIKIKTKVTPSNVTINISNNGKPILKEKQAEIFNKGYTTKKTGNGLGLVICKNNLNEQNADIILKQSDNKETIFEIKIKLP